MMAQPNDYEVTDTHARFHPVSHSTLAEALELAVTGVVFARENGIGRLLMDARKMTGFPVPQTHERYELGERFALEAHGRVKVALLIRPEHLDPQRFGMTVAKNRGLNGEVFLEEAEALEWLLRPLRG